MPIAEKSTLVRILTWTALFATLIVTPWFSYDPINVPKLAVIALGAFLGAGLLVSNFRHEWLVTYRSQLIVCALFILDLIFVLIFSGNNFYQEFFGTFGRATGFVAYSSLALLFVGSLIASGAELLHRLSIGLLIGGSLSIIYGGFQSFKIDPIDWANPYSPVVGFLGNPNFQSSFVGFSGVIAFAYLIQKTQKLVLRVAFLGYLLLAGYVISTTDSQQGFLVLAGGAGIVFLIWVKSSNLSRLATPLTFASAGGALITILGMLNKGPLASILYKPSVTYRGDYWRAGWEMTLEHPISGVGLDSYGDWYRRTRTIEATLRRGPEITSNAAHNVLLDFSSNGGFPLLVIYLLLTGLVIRSIVRLIKRSSSFDAPLAGLIAMWFAYQAQSIISLNQLGLAVWGWIISGALIGFEINTRGVDKNQTETPQKKKQKTAAQIAPSKVQPKTLVSMFGLLIVGVLVGTPPLVASTQYLSALKSQDALKVEKAAYRWPQDPARMGQIAGAFADSKLHSNELRVLVDGIKKFPDDFLLWNLLSQSTSATPEQKAEAKAQMKRLDPLNPELK
jgi:O-antigen ligase